MKQLNIILGSSGLNQITLWFVVHYVQKTDEHLELQNLHCYCTEQLLLCLTFYQSNKQLIT